MEQVYIFDFGDKIKVGYSTDVKKRRRTIELSCGIAAMRTYSVNADRSIEKLLHSKLENRLLGEFFAFPFEKAVKLLDEIMATYDQHHTHENGKTLHLVEKVKAVMKRENLTMTDLAMRTNQSPQALYRKISLNKIKTNEAQKIADATGCEFVVEFRFPDGTVI